MVVTLSIRHNTRIHVCFSLLLTSIKTSYDIAQPMLLDYKSFFFHRFLLLPQTAVYRQTYSGLYAVIQCIEFRATYYNAHELNRRH